MTFVLIPFLICSCIGLDLLYELSTYEERLIPIASGNYSYFVRRNKTDNKIFSLTISGTELKSISEDNLEWIKCRNLTTVILYMNKLLKLPAQLEQFSETITLVCIQNNQFQEIPSILYKFTNLEHLNLHGNYIASVPRSFKRFTNLARVYLGDNDLISLPDIFGEFPNLKEASFTANYLTRLPRSFSKLHKLENLDISNNALVKFPKHLLKLKNLNFLNIERNRIQRFTPPVEEDAELYKDTYNFFKQLVHIQFRANPIHEHELLKNQKGITGLLKQEGVFKELSETAPTRSLRVIVLGESGAGKTSVVEAITLKKNVIPTTEQDHRHTVGVHRYYLPVQIRGKTVLLHVWDHAGDNEYATIFS